MTILQIFRSEDRDEINAITTLYEGEHIIGRDKLLGCHDKKISRKHALIHIGTDGVTLKSVHVNPCYFKSSIENCVKLIQKDSLVPLENGDQFALLDTYWYKVKVISNNTEIDASTLQHIKKTVKRTCDESNNKNTSKRLKTRLNLETGNECSSQNTLPASNNDTTVENAIDSSTSTEISSCTVYSYIVAENILKEPETETNIPTSENPMNSSDIATSSDMSASTTVHNYINSENIKKEPQTDEPRTENPIDGSDIASSRVQIECSTENSAISPSKIVHNFIECENIKKEPPDYDENDSATQKLVENAVNSAVPSTSSIVPNSIDNIKREPPENNAENGDTHAGNNSDGKPKTWRDRCWYGHSCYRKNPDHRSNLSHPDDDDYADPNDDRPPCPYGAACYRTNMVHRREYKHFGRPAPKPSNIKIQINLNRDCPYCCNCRNRKPGYESDCDPDPDSKI